MNTCYGDKQVSSTLFRDILARGYAAISNFLLGG